MSTTSEQVLLRAYLQSADRAPRMPTYERMMKLARSEGLAGCTVLAGIMGYGSRGLLKPSVWSLVERVPVIVEIVDQADPIVRFATQLLPKLMDIGGLVTLERACVMMYCHRNQDQPAASLQLGVMLKAPLSTIPRIEAQGNTPMTIDQNGVLLRIFIGESDREHGKPLYEAILQRARELGLAGATVLRGVEGFGANSVVHKAKLLEMSTDLPMVIEIVDAQPKIELLLPYLQGVVQEGMITMEHVATILYRHNTTKAAPK